MKKEINTLLASDDATLKINEMFSLHRWKLDPKTDFLGREGEYLELEMHGASGKMQAPNVLIESRDLKGITEEVEKAMKIMMDYYTARMIKRWGNGYIV